NGGGITAGSLNVSNTTGTYMFSGGSITANSLTKSNGGSAAFTVANTISTVNITGGTLESQASGALGTSSISIDGGTAKFSTVNQTSTSSFVLANTAIIQTDTDLNTTGGVSGSGSFGKTG